MFNPLVQRAAFGIGHALRRPFLAVALGVSALGLLAFAMFIDIASTNGVSRAYSLLVWPEFLLVSALALVEGGTSIADERRRGTWDAICLTDLTDGEQARGKFLGSLLNSALVMLLAGAAHVVLATRGAIRWETVLGVHVVLAGTACAVAGIGVMVSSWTDKGLHGVAFAAAFVLFLWFGTFDQLASWGIVPWLSRTLQPIRQIEGLLSNTSINGPIVLVGRGISYLVFVGIVDTVALILASRRTRHPVGRALILRWLRSERRGVRSVWDDSLRWRETFDPTGRRIVALVFAAILISFVSLTASIWNTRATGIMRGFSTVKNGFILTLVVASGVLVGLRASVTLVDERVRQTLDLLRVVGIEPAELIRSKLLAILAPAIRLLPVIAVISFLGLGGQFEVFTPLAWLESTGNVAVSFCFSFFVGSISLWISARARSSRVAITLAILLLFAILLGTLTFAVSTSLVLPEWICLVAAASSPIYQVSIVAAHGTRFPSPVSLPLLLGILCAESIIALAVSFRLKGSILHPAGS